MDEDEGGRRRREEKRRTQGNARERAIRRDKKGTKRRNLRILFYHDSRVDAPPYFLTPLLTESSQPPGCCFHLTFYFYSQKRDTI